MADGKRYYWLKLQDEFFNSKRIKKLRRMAGGDTYTIIYLKMQLKAMKTDGVLTWTGLEESFAAELALDLDESEDDVKVTLSYLLHCGLAESSDNVNFFFPYSVENTGSETSAAQRMREMRQRNNVTPMLHERYGEIEEELEPETRVRNETTKVVLCQADARRIITAWNETGVTQIRDIDPKSKRAEMLRARVRAVGVDEVLNAIEKVKHSSFLRGQNKNSWQITFDWFVRPTNFQKVSEGNYDDYRGDLPETDNAFARLVAEGAFDD